jgi:polysaccharide pyruvyl transferase CsaB
VANAGNGKKFKVGISGSYGGMSLGDEAILRSIVDQFRSMPVEITVFSFNPKDTLARHKVERAVPVREMVREEILPEIQRLDLFILGGGGILFDGEADLFLREAIIAQEVGVPVMVYAVSAGPLKDRRTQQLVRDVLNRASIVSVRERRAFKLLEEIGVTREVNLTADPALLLKPEALPADALKREGLDPARRLVGLSVREPGPAAPDLQEAHYHSILANTADYMVERFDADVVFVPMERRVMDTQHSHAVAARMAHSHRAAVLRGEYTSGQMLSLMSHFDFAIGMRLHFLIFAALQRVPFVALPYAGKVTGFLEDLGLAAPPVQQLNAGRLIAYIDRSWDFRRDLKEKTEKALPALQERARETHKLAVNLLSRAMPAAA